MRKSLFLTVPVTLALLGGCVIAPVGPPRGYYGGPRVAIIAPAPVVVARPYYGYHYGYRW